MCHMWEGLQHTGILALLLRGAACTALLLQLRGSQRCFLKLRLFFSVITQLSSQCQFSVSAVMLAEAKH